MKGHMANKEQLSGRVEHYRLFFTLSLVGTIFAAALLGFSTYAIAVEFFASQTMYACVISLSVSLVYCVSALLLGFFQKRAAIEEEDKLLLEKRKERKATFDSSEDALFTASRTLGNYQRFSPYVISAIAALAIAAMLLFFWGVVSKDELLLPEKAMQGAFITFLLSVVSLFCGVFAIGQSRRREFRWLRPPGVWFVLSALMLLSASAAVMLKNMGIPAWDYWLSRVLMSACVVLAFELVINFVIEFYRPRTGVEVRPVFESRLLSFFTEPGGILRNIADTLDYQFGFKVSGTWIYALLEKSLTPLILIWLVLFWGFTSVDQVAPGEMGVRETLGRHSDTILSPGVYLKLPWPLQGIRKILVKQVQEVVIGPELKDEQGVEKKPDVVLWTQPHYAKEGRFLIATDIKELRRGEPEKENDSKGTENSPVSMIAAMIPVQFRVKAENVLDYAYKHQDPVKTVKDLSEKEITSYFAGADMLRLMSDERRDAIKTLTERIQAATDKAELGVEIIAVAFLDAHPPITDDGLPQAFQEVVGAKEEREAAVHDAKGYRARTIPQAEADSLQLVLQAEAYKHEQTQVSKAEIERFTQRLVGYRAMPRMYKLNALLELLEVDCRDARKYIVPAGTQYDVYVINLEEKQRLDLLDITDFQEDKK